MIDDSCVTELSLLTNGASAVHFHRSATWSRRQRRPVSASTVNCIASSLRCQTCGVSSFSRVARVRAARANDLVATKENELIIMIRIISYTVHVLGRVQDRGARQYTPSPLPPQKWGTRSFSCAALTTVRGPRGVRGEMLQLFFGTGTHHALIKWELKICSNSHKGVYFRLTRKHAQ